MHNPHYPCCCHEHCRELPTTMFKWSAAPTPSQTPKKPHHFNKHPTQQAILREISNTRLLVGCTLPLLTSSHSGLGEELHSSWHVAQLQRAGRAPQRRFVSSERCFFSGCQREKEGKLGSFLGGEAGKLEAGMPTRRLSQDAFWGVLWRSNVSGT